MEKLEYKSRSNQAKLIGTIVSIAGALIISLYKGQPIQTMKLQLDVQLGTRRHFLCSWFVRPSIGVCYDGSAMGTTLSAAASMVLVHDPNAWAVRMDIGLLATASSGVLCLALKGSVHAWASKKKGPVYVAMFKPLRMVIAMALGILFLGNSVFLGRVIGAVIIALGFYVAMWGKAQELEAVGNLELFF